jgi:phage terminase Nu1 subunit (DNA packaging protein)
MGDLFDERPVTMKNSQEVAAVYKKAPRTIRRWLRAGLPRLSDGRFDRGQVDAWLEANQGKAALRQEPEGEETLTWKGRRERAQAERHETALEKERMELRQRRGELIDIAEVEQLFVARILAVKQGLLSLARALPPLLIHCRAEREMEAIIARTVRDLLQSYATPLPPGMRPSASRDKFMAEAAAYFESAYGGGAPDGEFQAQNGEGPGEGDAGT